MSEIYLLADLHRVYVKTKKTYHIVILNKVKNLHTFHYVFTDSSLYSE